MKTEINRRSFIGSLGASALVTAAGCRIGRCCGGTKTQVGLQLYSIRPYYDGKRDRAGNLLSPGVGLAKALEEVSAIGYRGVEFAGYHGYGAKEIKSMLANAGLVACGTHVPNAEFGFDVKAWTFDRDKLKATCAFNTAYGNSLIICPGRGNFPPNVSGRVGEKVAPSAAIDEFTRRLCGFYNEAAVVAKAEGCRIGIHNHTWEHDVKMTDGTSFWDFFLSNTSDDVCMEQDVGWSACAGVDPCQQYAKYPHRSPTLHAKENGMGDGVKEFDAILGRPGRPGATPVPWDDLFAVTDRDGVEWYVVECERHNDSLDAVRPSFEFLKSKGRA